MGGDKGAIRVQGPLGPEKRPFQSQSGGVLGGGPVGTRCGAGPRRLQGQQAQAAGRLILLKTPGFQRGLMFVEMLA